MKSLYSFISIFLVGALIAFSPTDGIAGTSGKLQGVVQDDSGNPLPGANVVVEGTQRGATTDAEGYYAILGVDPGRQRVTASMVGYNTSTVEQVSVKADFTTTVDFTMTEGAIEAAEMVVIAKRPPVEPDRTSSRYVIDIFEIQNVPLIRTTEDLIELQAGVSLDGELRLRGSDNVWNTTMTPQRYYEVDGIKMVNDDGFFNYQQWTPLNKSALQEVSVIVGGMDAEYGMASGGVISLVSRESGVRFGGQLEARIHPPGKKHFGPNIYDSGEFARQVGVVNPWSDQDFLNYTIPEGKGSSRFVGQRFHVRDDDYDSRWGQFVEGSINGPLSDNAGFFVNARTSHRAAQFPDRWDNEPKNYQGSGNVTYRTGGNLKFKLGGIYSYREAPYGWQTLKGEAGTGGNAWFETKWPRMDAIFLPADYTSRGTVKHFEKVAYLTATHTLSPKTFYDVRVSFQQTKVDEGESVPEAQITPFRHPRDDWGFFMPWDDHSQIDENRKRITLKVDLTTQLEKSILGKVGFEFTRYDMFQNNYQSMSGAWGRWRQLIGVGDPWVGQDSNILNQLGGYAQTKMEFEGLVINAGVRFDALLLDDMWPNDAFLWPHYWYLGRFRNVERTSADPMTSVSPRVGISHPITERSTIRFHTGVFHEYPDRMALYRRWFWQHGDEDNARDFDVNGNGQIDVLEKDNRLWIKGEAFQYSRDIKPQKTIAFEAGIDWNFAGDFVLQATAYQKDLKGKVLRHVTIVNPDKSLLPPGEPQGNASPLGNVRGIYSSRGFELSFKKMFSRMTSFNLSWNIAWVDKQDGRSDKQLVHDASYVNGPNFFFGVTANADGSESPRVPTAAERAEFAAAAEANLANALARSGTLITTTTAWTEVFNSSDSDPGQYIQSADRVLYGRLVGPDRYDRRSIGAAQFLFSAPQDFHIKALAGARATMVYRVQNGVTFRFTPPASPTENRQGPIQTMTDVNFEKDFRFGDSGTVTGFLEIRNVWNQREDIENSRNSRYVLYGQNLPAPDDPNFLKYGDYKDITRWRFGNDDEDPSHGGFGEARREFVVGARLSF